MSSWSHASVNRQEPVQQSKKGLQQENQLYFARAYSGGKSGEARPPEGTTSRQDKCSREPMRSSLSRPWSTEGDDTVAERA
jgi:hypothetical protein